MATYQIETDGGTYQIETEDPAPQPSQQSAATYSPNQTISAQPNRGFLGNIEQTASDFINDLKYGQGKTAGGRVLQHLGAKGLYYGTPQQVGDFMGSPITGPVQTAQGAAQVGQGKLLQGAGNIGKGLLDTAQLPMALANPEAGEAGAEVAAKALRQIPSKSRAGLLFDEVKAAAGHLPVDVEQAGKTAFEMQQEANSGSSLPKVAKDYLRRVTDPNKGPLTFNESRQFASNAGRLSANEQSKITPAMRAKVSQLASDLSAANRGAAEQAGVAPQYAEAMRNYRNAATANQYGKKALKYVGKSAVGGLLAGAGIRYGHKIAGLLDLGE
jgi:hypothetical protein